MLHNHDDLVCWLGNFISRLLRGDISQISAVVFQNLIAFLQARLIGHGILLHVVNVNSDRIATQQTDSQIGAFLRQNCYGSGLFFVVDAIRGAWQAAVRLIFQAFGKLGLLKVGWHE